MINNDSSLVNLRVVEKETIEPQKQQHAHMHVRHEHKSASFSAPGNPKMQPSMPGFASLGNVFNPPPSGVVLTGSGGVAAESPSGKDNSPKQGITPPLRGPNSTSSLAQAPTTPTSFRKPSLDNNYNGNGFNYQLNVPLSNVYNSQANQLKSNVGGGNNTPTYNYTYNNTNSNYNFPSDASFFDASLSPPNLHLQSTAIQNNNGSPRLSQPPPSSMQQSSAHNYSNQSMPASPQLNAPFSSSWGYDNSPRIAFSPNPPPTAPLPTSNTQAPPSSANITSYSAPYFDHTAAMENMRNGGYTVLHVMRSDDSEDLREMVLVPDQLNMRGLTAALIELFNDVYPEGRAITKIMKEVNPTTLVKLVSDKSMQTLKQNDKIIVHFC